MYLGVGSFSDFCLEVSAGQSVDKFCDLDANRSGERNGNPVVYKEFRVAEV